MLRRAWQGSMITLARSRFVKDVMQRSWATSRLATRYVGGSSEQAGVARAQALLGGHGIKASLFYLGEYVDTPELVSQNVASKHAVAKELGQAGMDVHVSVDPTQIGYSMDPGLARRNAAGIAERIAEAAGRRSGFHALMLDMEDYSIVDATIALYDELRGANLPAALTLQAYLRRTEIDLDRQIDAGGRVRLVKGAFAAGSDIAFTNRADIKRNSRRLIDRMFSRKAQDRGFYPIIATHDDRLHDYAIEVAEKNGWSPGEYEFEMLFGIRPDVAEGLAYAGQTVRLYVPFGADWWPYAIRRIGENPANAVLLTRSILTRR